MTAIPPPPAFDRAAKRQILAIAAALWRSTLIGNQPPSTRAMYERMQNLRPGDLVFDSSTSSWLLQRDPDLTSDQWDGNFVTYLRTEQEVLHQHDDDPDDHQYDYTETYLVCMRPDGAEFHWTNAMLLAVPDGTYNWADVVTGGQGA